MSEQRQTFQLPSPFTFNQMCGTQALKESMEGLCSRSSLCGGSISNILPSNNYIMNKQILNPIPSPWDTDYWLLFSSPESLITISVLLSRPLKLSPEWPEQLIGKVSTLCLWLRQVLWDSAFSRHLWAWAYSETLPPLELIFHHVLSSTNATRLG